MFSCPHDLPDYTVTTSLDAFLNCKHFFPGMLEIHEKDTVVSGISHVDYLEIKNNAVGYFFWFGC